ncbi:LysM peptidoglycan-binding domain-containing protein [Mesobacillus maritimus]|uniref:LysM peptidoglycan-binding domain-containing protein n=2 Tax=Mesobacillus maritimus TaxID=1643336 RepID=A0ABS7K1R1_9BACI|nr:LysM peptidoglycan-binding domain-containing protein [Mesobacillus maritimus]
MPLTTDRFSSEALAAPMSASTQTPLPNSIYYTVSPGDTLWLLSQRFNISVDLIRRANHLTTDVLQIQQRLIIPIAIHTVGIGDYLTVLAKKYGTTVEAIKEANSLETDNTFLGQTLIIPKLIGGQNNQSSPSTNSPQANSTYTVVSGDSLSVIAKRFNTTVEALKRTNQLPSDLLRVGQVLTIPTNSETGPEPIQQTDNLRYTVVAGDSLWGIAMKYNVSLNEIRSANNLENDLLQIGQTILIPKTASYEENVPNHGVPAPTPEKPNSNYIVRAGDSLSVIAKRFQVSVEQLKQDNQLTGDIIRVGQVLTIPNGTSAPKPSTPSPVPANQDIVSVQKDLQKLGYYKGKATTGSYDTATTQAIKNFQTDYGLAITGVINEATGTAINHAIVKNELVKDTVNYTGVPYLWGGETPAGFDCSGFVYFMFNKHGVDMSRNTSAGLYKTGTSISRAKLQPGDLVFFDINSTGTISHVGFYMGNNQFISATSSKGIQAVSMDNSYWSKYYVGAKRIY